MCHCLYDSWFQYLCVDIAVVWIQLRILEVVIIHWFIGWKNCVRLCHGPLRYHKHLFNSARLEIIREINKYLSLLIDQLSMYQFASKKLDYALVFNEYPLSSNSPTPRNYHLIRRVSNRSQIACRPRSSDFESNLGTHIRLKGDVNFMTYKKITKMINALIPNDFMIIDMQSLGRF